MKKIYLLAFISALIAGLAVYLFASSLQEKEDNETQDETIQIVVAAVPIPADTVITAEMIQFQSMDVKYVHPQSVKSLTDVIGRINQYPVVVGEPILSHRIKEITQENDRLSYALEPGFRAITLSVDLISGVSGFISEGDHVDLIINTTVDNKNVSRYQVENLLVLRLGERKPPGESSLLYGTITLAVTPEQVLKINHGMNNGRLSLALRPVSDTEITGCDPYFEEIPEEEGEET